MAASQESVVVLVDVDNTLLDNDRVISDLKRHIEQQFGAQSRDHYFAIFEALHAELGYADYLGTLQRYRLENQCDTRLLLMSLIPRGLPVCRPALPGRAPCP